MTSETTGAKRTREYELTPKGRAKKLLRAARLRSPEVTITWEQIAAKLEGGTCEVTGLPFQYARWPKGRNPLSPSLDRRNSYHGYTAENTQVVCIAYNNAKGEWGEGVVEAVAQAVINKRGEK